MCRSQRKGPFILGLSCFCSFFFFLFFFFLTGILQKRDVIYFPSKGFWKANLPAFWNHIYHKFLQTGSNFLRKLPSIWIIYKFRHNVVVTKLGTWRQTMKRFFFHTTWKHSSFLECWQNFQHFAVLFWCYTGHEISSYKTLRWITGDNWFFEVICRVTLQG